MISDIRKELNLKRDLMKYKKEEPKEDFFPTEASSAAGAENAAPFVEPRAKAASLGGGGGGGDAEPLSPPSSAE